MCTTYRGRKKKVSFVVSEIQSGNCAHKRGKGALGPSAGFGPEKPVFLSVLERLPALEYTKRVYKNNARAQATEARTKANSLHTCSFHVTSLDKNVAAVVSRYFKYISITEIR